MIRIRRLAKTDIDAGLSLCRQAGWNQTEQEWNWFLTFAQTGCFAALDPTDRVIGTATTIRYQEKFSWIGMVLVDPAFRRQGIATRLMNECLVELQNEDTVKLDATPDGSEVYRKLGFQKEYTITRMRHPGYLSFEVRPNTIKSVGQDDLMAICVHDLKVFGADRHLLLQDMWNAWKDMCFCIGLSQMISGYCFARQGFHAVQIGPVFAKDPDDATQLIDCALSSCKGKPVIIDVIDEHVELKNWLTTTGFKPERQLIRMYRGKNSSPGNYSNQFAILGPEFG